MCIKTNYQTLNSYTNEFEPEFSLSSEVNLLSKIENYLDRAVIKTGSSTEIDPTFREVIKGASSIFSSFCMAPVDRLVAAKTVGNKITRAYLCEIAHQPFLGACPRLFNQFVGTVLTFGMAAALNKPLEQKFPHHPVAVSSLALAAGTLLDRITTSPMTTLGFRMQTQKKGLGEVFREIVKTGRPWQSMYAGTSALMIRDLCYFPICIPLAESINRFFAKKREPSLALSTASFIASGTAASCLSYPWQYIGMIQKDSLAPISALKVIKNTWQERGFLGFYRGFGINLGRLAFLNLLFGASISLVESFLKSLKQS
jgi:hypothetical protein